MNEALLWLILLGTSLNAVLAVVLLARTSRSSQGGGKRLRDELRTGWEEVREQVARGLRPRTALDRKEQGSFRTRLFGFSPVSGDALITWYLGLHTRPSAYLVTLARKFRSDIMVASGDQVADAKSVMEVMMLAAEQGTVLHFEARGPDSKEAIDALVALVVSDFGTR